MDTSKRLLVKSCRYRHPVLGAVHVKVHGTTRHLKARWVGQEVCVTIPPDCLLSDYERFIGSVQQKLLDIKPKPAFALGQIIDAPKADFTIKAGSSDTGRDLKIEANTSSPLRGKCENYIITLSPSLIKKGIADAAVQDFINKALLAAAKHATASLLLPHAKELADKIGRHPGAWDVKETKTRLGCCSSRGVITLSPRLIFLPEELSDFVIYHELAHLSEMNHSTAFHELCDRYCGGREAELIARIRAFHFPVF